MQRKYLARADQWGIGETNDGKEQVAVECVITTPDADIERITWYGYFTEKTIERTIESLRIFGWTGNEIADLDGLDTNEVELVIEDEEYKGNVHPKVRWVNRPGGFALKAPLSGDRMKAFSASMRDKIKAFDAAAGTKPAPKAKPTPAPHIGSPGGPPPLTDDDIPF